MHLFRCTNCENRVFFENTRCLNCQSALGFDPKTLQLIALELLPGPQKRFSGQFEDGQKQHFAYCRNQSYGVCNWLTETGSGEELCRACALNRTIPNLSSEDNHEAWHFLEIAKKRLIYSLLRLGLPFDDPGLPLGPMVFDFKVNAMTGHDEGVITISVDEADPVERERRRDLFDEPYRSLLGHLRHESAHFYWSLLVEAEGRIEEFRTLFGDERQDYTAAISAYHANGPVKNWQARYVSAYASAHPWEDWAETWAHYMHMVDAVDTAEAGGLEPRSIGMSIGAVWRFQRDDIYREQSFEELKERWLPLTIALNSLSRSMGHRDFYPFVIPEPAYEKLAFIHHAIRAPRGMAANP